MLLAKFFFEFHAQVQKCHFEKLTEKKVQKGGFLKKPSQELIFFVVLGYYESLEGLER